MVTSALATGTIAGPSSIERRLSNVLSEFARTVVTDFPIQAILDHLVIRIVDVLPVSAAGVTLISAGADPRYIAASDESAMRFEQLQTELGEGPCIAAFETGEAVTVADLRRDTRFPQFSPRALAEGLAAVFTFPLRQSEHQLGALDLYRNTEGPLDAEAMAAAQTLADVATAYLINAQARADLQDSSDRNRERSLHDPLTGLANRSLLVERLDHAILRCRRSKLMVAVLYADLDGFKSVNDTYGHRTGDELLAAVAVRLAALVRPGDTLARLAGDEFAVLCEDIDDATQVEVIAARIDGAFDEAFVLSAANVTLTASVGVAFAGQGDSDSGHALEAADAAMYRVKRQGGARHTALVGREQHHASRQATLAHDLVGAADRGELHNGYQPIVAAADGQIIGVEAILLWDHPTIGVLPAGTVVPLADQAGLISGIGRLVLERACSDRQRWGLLAHRAGIEISVKVAPHQLLGADYAGTVAAVLGAAQTDPSLVTLEVTEGAFLQDGPRSLIVLKDLRRLGVRVALDRFGAGYSSLTYLTTFPLDVVRLDRALTARIDRDPGSRLVVKAVIGVAHAMGMTVVAGGVDSAEHVARVVALGCDGYQFHFARLMTAAHLDALLAGE